MKSWLRQHHYACRVALLRLWKQPFSSLSNIVVIAITLSVPLLAWAILLSAKPVVQTMPLATEISVYLDPKVDADTAQALRSRLQQEHGSNIQNIQLIDKDQAAQQLQNHPAWKDALQSLESNPLPHTLVIQLPTATQQSATAEQLAHSLQQLDEVDHIQLDSDWLRHLENLLNFGQLALAALSTSIGIIVMATVFNTIRLQAQSQHQEIAVARLVGATEHFVRRPFLYSGAISGGLACLLAIGLSKLALIPLNTALNKLAATYQAQLYVQLPPLSDLLFAIAFMMVLTAIAARWSVNRHAPL